MICFDFQYAKAMYRAAAAGVIVSISGTLTYTPRGNRQSELFTFSSYAVGIARLAQTHTIGATTWTNAYALIMRAHDDVL